MATPAGMAYRLSRGLWVPYPYLVELSRWLVDVAVGRRRRVIVSMPPRHGKSELISRWFPAWYMEHWQRNRIALCSYGASLAAEHGRWVRDTLLNNEESLRVRVSRSTSAANAWSTTAGGRMMSVGVGGPLTGKGYNVGIIDDPIKNREEADSERVRSSLRSWYSSTFYTRKEPGASIVILMTRWHENDLVGWLLDEAKKGADQWDVLSLPAVAEEGDQMGRAIGEALCPWRYSGNDLAEIKRAVQSRDWYALYQQRPAPEDGEIFKRQWWRRYSQLPETFDAKVVSVDCTFKDVKTADWVVIQVWGRRGPDRYLLHQVRDRMTFTQTVNAIRAVCAQYPDATAKLIEDKANGPAVIDTLKREISGIIAVEPHGGKTARAWASQPFCEAGNVWIPDGALAAWVGDFVEECAAFPGKHDDQVDAFTQAMIYMARPVKPVATVSLLSYRQMFDS